MKPLFLFLLIASVLVAGITSAATDSTLAANKALVTGWADLINTRQYDSLATFIADSFSRHCPAEPDLVVTNRDQYITYLRDEAVTFPDCRITMRMVVAEGDLVAFWATFEATQEGQLGPFPPLHKKMIDDFAGVFRIENGELTEHWVTWDNVNELTQLGHFPPSQPTDK